MTAAEVRAHRQALGMTQSELAYALELAGENGKRTVRHWETESGKFQITGPARVAIRLMVEMLLIRSAQQELTNMTDDTIPEPISAEGLALLLLSVARDIDGGYPANAVWAATCRMSAALIDAQAAEVAAWRECALYDATMEGPVFKGWDRSAMDRARRRFIERAG